MIPMNNDMYIFFNSFGTIIMVAFLMVLVASFVKLVKTDRSKMKKSMDEFKKHERSISRRVLLATMLLSVIGLIGMKITWNKADEYKDQQEVMAIESYVADNIYNEETVVTEHLDTRMSSGEKIHKIAVKENDGSIYIYSFNSEPIVGEYIYEKEIATNEVLKEVRRKSMFE